MINTRRYLGVMLVITFLVLPTLNTYTFASEDRVDGGPWFFVTGDQRPLVRTLWGNMDISELYDFVPVRDNDRGTEFWIVQFDGPVTESNKADLSRSGFEILEYLPDFSFIINTGSSDPLSLVEIDDVVAAGPFPSGLKMDPELYDDLEGGGNVLDMVGEEFLLVDTFIPIEGIEMELKAISPHVEQGSTTRYVIGPTIGSRDDLLGIDGISHIEPYYSMELHNNVSKHVISVQETWDTLGLDGTGQIVTIADTGLDTGVDSHTVDGDINLDFDNRATIVNWAGTSPDDGHSHGTHVTGSVAGDGSNSNGEIQGMAPNASIFFQAIMTDGGSLAIPSNTSLLFEQAYDNGSRIHTNSWGANVAGAYSSRSRDVDWFLYHYPEMIILYSAGNNGVDWYPEDGRTDQDTLGSPATSKNAVTVGASENYRLHGGSQGAWGGWRAWRYVDGGWTISSKYPVEPIFSDLPSDDVDGIAAFSSVGPTDDGRLKPDVVAPGTNILSCRSSVTGAGTGWGVFNSDYVYMGGTSMSTPITAGATVLVREFYNSTLGMDEPSGALMKATLINGAMDLTPGQYGFQNATVQEIQGRPDMHQGWGRINISESLEPDGGNLAFLDNKEGIVTGEEMVSYFNVTSSTKDLRLTLAWADYPGATYASVTLVNDLDLVLVAPNGTEYNGNDWTSPYNNTFDRRNPVEGITISSPAVGTWKIIIRGYNIPMGPQHFALVASGAMTNLSGAVSIEGEYISTMGDEIPIKVIDQDLIGTGSITVKVISDSDTTGIDVTLTELGDSGYFEGSTFTQQVSGTNASRITVSQDDIIMVEYTDTNPADVFNATAVAKDPVLIDLEDMPELYLVQSENERIHIKGLISENVSAWWRFDDAMDWRSLHDNGNSTFGDSTAFDLNLSDVWYVPSDLNGTYMLQTMIDDPFLGGRIYDHLTVTFNSSMPRYPKGVSVAEDPEGNAVTVSWLPSNETDLAIYNIYVNASSPIVMAPSGWILFSSTPSSSTMQMISGLVDGVEYSFRVSVVDTTGNESSLSVPYNATPMDLIAPTVTMITTPRTIVGEIYFQFTGSMDLDKVEMEFYNDSNGNGLVDDGDWEVIGEGPPTGVYWDTRNESGGPGDVDSMFIRYRGKDEVNNTSDWFLDLNFRVDNTGPALVEIISPPSTITNQESYLLTGRGEGDGYVEVWIDDEPDGTYTCNGLGGFDFWMNLTEGYNKVVLKAFDQYGAGPTSRNYSFSLDTMDPTASLDVEDPVLVVRDIQPYPLLLNSTSTDSGVDDNFTFIENLTWRVVDPLGSHSYHYGIESLPLTTMDLGIYTIDLTVRDPAKNSNKTTLKVEIVDRIEPAVTIDGDLTVNERETVAFIHNVTDNDPFWFRRSQDPIFWQFTGIDFLFNSTDNTALVNFPLPGIYTVSLSIVDGGGNRVNATQNITVLDVRPPEGRIEGPSPVTLGIPATFSPNLTDNDRNFPAGAIYKWNLTYQEGQPEDYWSVFGEGGTFTYNFTESGSYILTLTVTDVSDNSRDISMVTYTIGDITPPRIVEIVPYQNLTHQFPEDLKITVIFNEDINASTVDRSTMRFIDQAGEDVNFSIIRKGAREYQLVPDMLEFGKTYRLTVGTGIRDTWDNKLSQGITLNYTIRTMFSLDFPSGVFPSDMEQNFTGDEESIYNISVRFTNPVQVSSILNGLTVISIKKEFINGEERDVRREVSFFFVNQGEDPNTAIISVQMDQGTRYNITLDTNVRDTFDYRLDRMYQWEIMTYMPPVIEGPDDDPVEDTDDFPGWVKEPILWILLVIIIVILIVVFAVISRIRHKRKMDRIWGQESSGSAREKEEKEEIRIEGSGMGVETPKEDNIQEQSPPSYEDLYKDFYPPSEEEVISEEPAHIDGGSGIDWDEDDMDDEMEWDDDEEIEEVEEFDDDDEELDWD